MSSKDLRISEAEHKTRIEEIRGEMRRSRIGALYLTNPTRIMYTTGFSTYRPNDLWPLSSLGMSRYSSWPLSWNMTTSEESALLQTRCTHTQTIPGRRTLSESSRDRWLREDSGRQ